MATFAQTKNSNTFLRAVSFSTVRARTVSYICVAFAVSMVFTYLFLLASTTVHVTMRKDLQSEIRDIQGVIADLESEYLSQREVVTIEEAYARGFVDVEKDVFVYRDGSRSNVALAHSKVQ